MCLVTIFVGLSLLYVLRPMQTQAYNFLHKISHHLAAESNHNNEHHHHDHAFLSYQRGANIFDDHIKEHSHELLSFINTVIDTHDSPNEKDNLFEVKVEKHLVPIQHEIQGGFITFDRTSTWFHNTLTENLRPEITVPPPRVLSS
ncbi:hypothetical protein CLV82_2386 [Zeaxanthinibacter enoshimensis]|uniref:Uncharacterized protein n=1 Tax=Zeaxanthinibacter enoshimensis TaxID=392009 RepID=A0A4R6TFZ8_9FLAO|nr:hypothetical protein CLV82_2386 [Zeaxanthinibacter enoshimensis]